ncbi:MAG TPA: SpoIIE family protein phosphatase [Pseudomonadaceae bacterium]|nr:SpoIIE family protein phosphatase [Pseudomonadaceae bacterium]
MKSGIRLRDKSTILVIEDDAAICATITSALRNLEYHVVLASSPEEGLERFHSASPELVIYDIHSPKADTFGGLHQFFDLAPDLPLIVLAERGSHEDLMTALRLGVSDYLILPLADHAILQHSIDSALRRARLIEENSRIRKKLELINTELEQRIEIFQQDQQAGRHVQINMMPIPPRDIGGFHFNHKVVPSLYLSGDTVDYKPVSRHETLFYIADVSGHGSSSAFITVLLRFRIEQMRWEKLRGRFVGDFTPAAILALLNRDLLESGLDKHITVFMGILDERDSTLRYSVAGHHPLPVLYHGGRAEQIPLASSSLPIGLLAEAVYFDEELTLAPDFALTLFSDGILEILEEQGMAAKEEKLRRVVEESKGDFVQVKDRLKVNKSITVPDDIAVMSVTWKV